MIPDSARLLRPSLFMSLLGAGLLLAGCSAEPAVCDISPLDVGGPDIVADTAPGEIEEDTQPADLGTPDPGEFGAPCNGNADCNSGWCVESTGGYVCTKGCDTDCPAGWDCKSVSSGTVDIVFLCVPRIHKLCAPCISDGQCSDGVCLNLVGGLHRCLHL